MLMLINNITVGCFVSVNFEDKLSSQRSNSQVSFQNPKPTTISKFLSKACLQIAFIEKKKYKNRLEFDTSFQLATPCTFW